MALVKRVPQSTAVHSIFWGLLLLVTGLGIFASLSVFDWLKTRKDARKVGSFLSLNPSKTSTNLTEVLEDVESADRTSRDVIVSHESKREASSVSGERVKVNGKK